MAGESILSAFLPVILDKLISPAIQLVGAAFGTNEKLQKLKRILESIQSVLVDAEERQNSETFVKNWLSELTDLAYEAEDVLEVFDFEAQRKRRSRIQDNNMRRKVFFYCSFYKPIMTRFSLCRRLNHIIEKVEARADEIHKFNFQLNKEVRISFGRPQTHSYVDKENVIGREEDKEDISLRVLSSQVKLFNKTVSVRHLRHLRWLDLSFSYIMELPEGICSLYNLQTLKLSGCEMLKKLPENLTDLVNLRRLYIDGCYNLVHMPRGMGRLKYLHTLTMYIVSAQVGRGLEQLRDLNLGGTLELYGMDKVSNVIDAKDAGLSSKLNLHSIKLSWKGADSLEVFEALKPHDGLRMLEVWNYGGQQFPKWMNAPKQLENLVQIRLHDCGKCKELPPLAKLPFLEMLELFHMDDVKYFISKITWCDGELNATLFPSLKELQMIHMENLENWWEVDESNAQVLTNRQFFPSLMTLVTYNCKKLTTIPAIPSLQILRLGFCSPNLTDLFSFTLYEGPRLPRLQELCICDCQSLVHLPACLPSIRSLKIKDCKRLESLSGPGSLTKLQELLLRGCDDLTSLPQGMESLTILHIFKCNKLVFLPEDLTKLNFLVLQSCDSLVFLPQGMGGLTNLKISKCKRLTSLPKGLIKLRNLNLDGCDGLMSLHEGVECFTELQYLTISECNKLRSLPKALQQQLPRLSGLRIIGHDELIRPFQFGGDYWHLVESIPYRYIIQNDQNHESSTSEEKCMGIPPFLTRSKCYCLRQSF
ncbi:hypothetical protein M5K25_010920 [Dendrobium thyrsiflorum]|uniref:Rx N-terminal domain-containing protein n=1 Tax=Dendrobium thyrsiflorum TaxID=117978 RepID=A0ABD0V0Y5_DENTH